MRRLLLFTAIFACNTDTFVGDAGPDAESDVSVSGGGDSSVDAIGKDVVVKPLRFCEKVDANFCADFDIPGDAGAGFTPPNTSGGWILDFKSTQTADASPFAVSVVTVGDASGIAVIENPTLSPKLSDGPATRIVVEADVFLTNVGLVPDPITVFSAGVIPAPQLSFGLAMQSNLWKLVRRGGGSPVALSPQPPMNQWVHAVLGIDIDSNNGNVTLDIGSSHAQMSAITGIDGGSSTYPGYVSIGGSDVFFPNNVSLSYFVDNVVVRWQ